MRRVPTTMSAPLQLFQCLQLRLVKEVHLISTSEVEMHNAGVDTCGRDACHGYAMVSKCKLNVCKSNQAPEDPFYIDQFTISQARCSLSVCPAGRSPPCFRNASRSCKKPKNGAKPVPAERLNMRCILLRYLQQSDRMTVKASESMSTMITQAFSKAFHLERPETWTPRRVIADVLWLAEKLRFLSFRMAKTEQLAKTSRHFSAWVFVHHKLSGCSGKYTPCYNVVPVPFTIG